MRALVARNGTITEVWHYDSWGNILSMPAQWIEQPFLWNGAYGYEYIPFTGLYHIGARKYDPRTALLGLLTLATAPAGIDAGAPNPTPSERPTMRKGYYRFPTIYGDTVVFTCEDDLWTVSVDGGYARRLTTSLSNVITPRFSPDGQRLAWQTDYGVSVLEITTGVIRTLHAHQPHKATDETRTDGEGWSFKLKQPAIIGFDWRDAETLVIQRNTGQLELHSVRAL